MDIIETKNLTKFYGSSKGIEDLSLNVKEGEILGFIGPNGAGKSTTIRLLLSLIYPTSGSATIFGKDVIKYGPEIKRQIGYMPSEVFYYENMRVQELLDYSASFYGKDCSKRIKELSGLLKLDLTKKIDDLSYGNKKKVGIVQGLLHDPDLIILDEPTGGLDPLMQKNFFELLKEENRAGKTIFFSSHILSEVQKICDRVAIIREGTLINIESMEHLLQNNYKRIHLTTAKKAEGKLFDIPGVSDLKVEKNQVSLLYKGDVNTISRIIAQMDLVDFMVGEPDLEEIFMHYYT
ncbi:MAG: ABC transporter ATP-binding protein [Thermoleophilia bacterium]|nr:ABC transporter ATP-binding protein [Thermoleophilia bacterium]